MPVGWNYMIQAVIMYRINEHDYAREFIRSALKQNADLTAQVNELMPKLQTAAVVPSMRPFIEETKFIVCYNPHVGLGNLAVVMTSAHMLAKLTGRKFLLHWNVNTAVQTAFKMRDVPGVGLLSDSVDEVGLIPKKFRNLLFFHMMDSMDLGKFLELLACSDFTKELSAHRVVTVSSNMFFAPLLAMNPYVPEGTKADFPELLEELLAPSDAAAKRALDFAKDVTWGQDIPVIAIHIRAREEGEDNDDWPTASSPNKIMLQKLRLCVEKAVERELQRSSSMFGLSSGEPQWDVFIASTTEKARNAVKKALEGAKGLRNVLQMQSVLMNRRSEQGSVDAMAEALLISRANVFVRMVIGTSGFSTFAYLSNALRRQNDWVKNMPELHRSGFAPNYLVTESCGLGRCFVAPPHVRMGRIDWHGEEFTHRSCGKVADKLGQAGGADSTCHGLSAVAIDGGDDDEF